MFLLIDISISFDILIEEYSIISEVSNGELSRFRWLFRSDYEFSLEFNNSL